jgi:hypothetical protein
VIEQAVNACEVFITVIGPQWLTTGDAEFTSSRCITRPWCCTAPARRKRSAKISRS